MDHPSLNITQYHSHILNITRSTPIKLICSVVFILPEAIWSNSHIPFAFFSIWFLIRLSRAWGVLTFPPLPIYLGEVVIWNNPRAPEAQQPLNSPVYPSSCVWHVDTLHRPKPLFILKVSHNSYNNDWIPALLFLPPPPTMASEGLNTFRNYLTNTFAFLLTLPNHAMMNKKLEVGEKFERIMSHFKLHPIPFLCTLNLNQICSNELYVDY